jgi:uncharacterized membrane protein
MVEFIIALGAELGTYLLFALCCFHAIFYHRKDLTFLFSLIAGSVYGVALEYLSMIVFDAYTYPQFLVMVGPVPLMIGMDWALIIYTAMITSDKLSRGGKLVRSFIDAFLVLNIDFGIDAIAIRLGFWTWNPPGVYYGVPLSNFFAWYVVGWGFSWWLRLFRSKIRRHWQYSDEGLFCKRILEIITPFIVVVLSIFVLFISLFIFGLSMGLTGVFAGITSGYNVAESSVITAQIVIICIFLLPSVFVILANVITRRFYYKHPLTVGAVIIGIVPACFHGFFFVMIFWYGIYKEVPVLLVISVVMGSIGAILHIWPYSKDLYLRIVRCKPFKAQVRKPVTIDDMESEDETSLKGDINGGVYDHQPLINDTHNKPFGDL